MEKKLVIAPIGPQGAGKEYLTKAILKFFGEDHVSVHSSGGIVRQIAEDLGMKKDRINCNLIMATLIKNLGEDVLACRIEKAILGDCKQRVVYDCPRRPEDEAMLCRLREFCTVITVYLDRSQQDRFNALKNRVGRGEKNLTWEAFLVDESLAQEVHIRQLGENADFTIKCFGTEKQLDTQKENFCVEKFGRYK